MATVIEGSTYSKAPAYNYIRQSDKLPNMHGAGSEPVAKVKLFNPTGRGTWYIAEYDPETRLAWGLCDIDVAEIGYVSMEELTSFRGRFGLPIERDLHWTPRPLSECKGS